MRLPAGEGALTRLNRVKGLLSQIEAGRQPSKLQINRALVEYYDLLKMLWLWGFKKKSGVNTRTR